MTIVKTECKKFLVDYICDQCGIGKYRPTGITLMSNPQKFTHYCNNDKCKHEMTSYVNYPYYSNEVVPRDQIEEEYKVINAGLNKISIDSA